MLLPSTTPSLTIPSLLTINPLQTFPNHEVSFERISSSILLGSETDLTELSSAGVPGWSVFWSPETVLEPLNAASEIWIRSLVWIDFRVAVSFFVVAPLLLLVWSMALRVPPKSFANDSQFGKANNADPRSQTAETILRLMTSYWQASSLLLLTVMLNIQESNLGVFTGLLAQAMIVVSLYWWEDLNKEVSISKKPIARAFCLWRNVAGVAASAGVLVQAPFQGCLSSPSLAGDALCAPWLEPPKFAAGLVGLQASPFLGNLAYAGCALYSLVLAYYGLVLLPSVGREGRAKRPKLMDVATPIGAWIALGFLDPQNKGASE